MPLRVALLANWGLGREALLALAADPRVRLVLVVTRATAVAGDPWADCLARELRALDPGGSIAVVDHSVPMERLGRLLVDHGVELLVCHAYMRRLPRQVFAAPRLGTVNIHASLLPRHRGPAPGHWVLAGGDAETGLTAHLMDEGLDTGPIVHQERLALRGNEDMPALLEGQKPLVRPLLHATIGKLLTPGFTPLVQDESGASYAPKPNEVRP